MIAEIEPQNEKNEIIQTNRLVFQRFREKYEKIQLEKQQQKRL